MLMLQGLTQPVEGYIGIEKQKRKEYDPATQKYRTKNFTTLTLERIYTPRQVLYELPAAQERKQLAAHIDDLWGDETPTTAEASEPVENAKDSEPESQKNGQNLQQTSTTQKAQAIALLNTAHPLKRSLPRGEVLDALNKTLKPVQGFVGGQDMAPGSVATLLEQLQAAVDQAKQALESTRTLEQLHVDASKAETEPLHGELV
jgi:hypothetical protein